MPKLQFTDILIKLTCTVMNFCFYETSWKEEEWGNLGNISCYLSRLLGGGVFCNRISLEIDVNV